MFLLGRFCRCNQTPFQQERCTPEYPHPPCEVAQAMSNIFRSKILNTTLLGYSRKKIHTSPNYGWQVFFTSLPQLSTHISWTAIVWSYLPGQISQYNLWSINGQDIKSHSADICCVPPCIGLILFKYDEIMILFLQMQRVL